jgi:CubicO group peptidase (beta-lactamase class C family)
VKVDASQGSAWYYQYQWWLPSKEGDFYAAGHLGQFIYVNPSKNLLIVRLGKKGDGINWPVAFRELALKL